MPPSLAESSNSWNLIAFDIQRSRVDPTTGLDLNDDTSTNAPKIIVINGMLAGFTLVVVLLRFFVRTVMLKSIGSDDWLIAIAMLCGIGTFACFIGETRHGIGMNSDAIPFTENIKMLHWQFFHSIIVTVGISFIKISVACFLLRLVPNKNYKIFLHGTIVFLVIFTLVSAFTITFACIPVQASWDLTLAQTAKCYSKDTFTAIGLFNSCVNILTDVLFSCLPIPMVWNLQVNMRTKMTLIFILSLGMFACVAAIVKTVLQSRVYSTPNMTREDTYFIWNSVELYVGITAASLPSLRPLFKNILESTKALRSRMTTSENARITKRHKYYMQEDGPSIAMNTLSGKEDKKFRKSETGQYNVQITTKESLEDLSLPQNGSSSDSVEHILPLQGIQKTVNVTVTR